MDRHNAHHGHIDGLPPLMSVEDTRAALGGRGRGWVYERIAAGDFETIVDGSRRLIVSESVLRWIEAKRAEAAKEL